MKSTVLSDSTSDTTSAVIHPIQVIQDQVDRKGITYKEIAELTGKSINSVRKSASMVSTIIDRSIKVEDSDSREVLLTEEGAKMVVEYLEDASTFKARHTNSLVVKEETEALTISESNTVDQSHQEELQDEADMVNQIETVTRVYERVAGEQAQKQQEDELYRQLSLQARKATAVAKLQKAQSRLEAVQSGKLRQVEELKKSNQELQSSIEDVMGKLGISISLPWK